jgi:hypothetical protein
MEEKWYFSMNLSQDVSSEIRQCDVLKLSALMFIIKWSYLYFKFDVQKITPWLYYALTLLSYFGFLFYFIWETPKKVP